MDPLFFPLLLTICYIRIVAKSDRSGYTPFSIFLRHSPIFHACLKKKICGKVILRKVIVLDFF